MTEWLIENREWLGTAIPFSAIMSAIIFLLLSSKDKPAAPQQERKGNTVPFISNGLGYAVSNKIEFPILMPEHKQIAFIK
ncbi:hypothetical protein GCM10011375_22840 [Hymenobacter qilianensis]|uniref:Uncharacterized protein n=1 Tax=Hymenobacter qilianensis TaxID=1385715 RepID=A0ACB5PSE1_9BACT|nr:hypothetical protein [Hymenobacter qilianensis]GGF67260.1 hypothetical protein GCM10011375_22840 [Hymenobacter qilianensis]